MEILKDLHTSIVEACEVSIRNAQQELQSQLAAREARVKEAEANASIALEAQRAAEQRVEELQREVTALRNELITHNADPKELESPIETSNLEREFAPKNIWRTDLLEADQLHDILKDKYTTLYTDLQAFSRSWSGLKSKLLQHKKKLQLWDKQLNKDSFTILLDKGPVTFQRVLDTDATVRNHRKSQTPNIRTQIPSVAQVSGLVSNNGTPPRNLPNRTDANPRIKIEESSQQITAPTQPVATATQNTSASGDILSSESGSDVLYPLPNIETKKRKRVLPSAQAEPRQGAPERPVLVKAETMSSSPMHQAATLGFGGHFPSTQDLDEIGGTVPTPTKRHAHREVHWEDEGEASTSNTQNVIPDREPQHHTVLQSVDGNIRSPRCWGKGPELKKRGDSSVRALLMAEDGERGDDQDRSQKKRARSAAVIQHETPRAKADGVITRDRLQGLLEGALPSKSPLRSPREVSGRIQSGGTSNTRQKSRTTKSASPYLHSEPVDQPSQMGPEVQPDEEPYRSRPLHRLNLGHFKINPARNQGLDYAYDTVVRKKDDRKCMSGCTRPGCCGDRFRAMARMGVQGTNASAEQQEEDQRILEEYVGEDRHLLEGMSDKDRENLLVEARARALANQYGRHRHTHQRARSPPGFWRTEMPSTQEIEADREAARKLEREKVEERYREAMRPGGLWTWADE
ncbi:uncharacterized protein N7496_010361 [Penicillium cataractarum]|uniref:DNA endonuclease activator Ctp1 C-terminal domain-containing protein n=1 Tax=Penicillium cataractarum TaxID=2100454 RepID=A0A9W9RVK5_9EURO|nr:uncharacterized protein N7496_010361 [Penicillium cataractarum]KAJ5364648.1 hypothetical protein N7496_010361 [Penicillium cataractarum]